MKFTPRQDYVIVQMDKPLERTKNGIALLPSTSEDKLPATVIAIGPGRLTEFGSKITIDDLAVGDRVFFNKFSATELDEQERLYMLRGHEISCKIND